MTPTAVDLRLSEEFVQDCFHSYLKSSLTQAKVERLVDTTLLSSAEGDLMITGPALCLYFAALRCTTNPPSVPLPRRKSKASQAGMITELSEVNCPTAFLSFLRVWIDSVPRIQSLVPEHQHDLARIICGLNPVSSPNRVLHGIAADLRAVAIEISQRRTFQNRYAVDLQAAIDAGEGADDSRITASFVPPPAYDATPTTSFASSSTIPSYESSVSSQPSPPNRQHPPRDSKPTRRRERLQIPPPVPPKDSPNKSKLTVSPLSPSRLSPSRISPAPTSPPRLSHARPSPSPSRLSPVPPPPSRLSPAPPSPSRLSPAPPSPSQPSSPAPPSPSFLSDPSTPAISIIRETLYAALADVIERSPSIRQMMKSDPPRAYFAAVGFAILDVATTATTADGAIRAVMGQKLSLEMCPPELKPFMAEFVAIGSAVKKCEAEDDADAIKIISKGGMPLEPRMERTKQVIENGVGYCSRRSGDGGNRRSLEGRALTLANRINALALGMTRLKAFRDRQNDVFIVLAGLGS